MKYLMIKRRLRGLKSGDTIYLMDDGIHAWVNGIMKNYEMKNGVLRII